MLGLNIESLKKYPFESGLKGIDFSILERPVQSIRGESGRELMVVAKHDLFEVADMSGWSDKVIKMVATARENQLSLGLYTRWFDYATGILGDRHPDFNIWEFARVALRFFADNRLTPITTMMSNYDSNSFTAKQYWALREQGKPKSVAARKTVDGKLARLLGFKYLGSPISDNGGSVRVLWSNERAGQIDN